MNFNKDTEIGSIPNEWDVYTVKKLIKDNVIFRPMDGNHGSIHPKTSDYVKEGIPFIMAKDLLNNNIDIINCKFITEEKAKSLKKGFAKKGDILLTHKATIGRTVIVQEIPYKFVVLTPQVTYYRIRNKDMLNNIYLKYYFDYDKFKSLLKLWSGSGSTRLYLGITAQQKLPIVVPPLAEQKAISKILSSLDEKIELNDQINKNLEEMAQAIFKHWFVDFEFPDDNGKPYKSSGGKMIESELGMIPEGWKVKKLKDISKDIITGKTPSTKDKTNFGMDIPFVKIPDMHHNVYITKTEKYLSKSGITKSKIVPKDSILVSCIATPGLVSLASEECQTNQQINTVICKNEKVCYFAFFSLRELSKYIITLGSTGSATLNLNKSEFSKLKLIVPTFEQIEKYYLVVNSIFNKIYINSLEIEKLKNIRDTLLPKLMSGEIRVPLEKEGGTQ